MHHRIKDIDWARAAFWLAIALAIFLVGGAFGSQRLQPYVMFEDGYKAASALQRELFRTRHDRLKKIRYPGDGVVVHDPARAYHGLTLIQGLFPEGVELRLLDMEGEVVHRWPVRFFEIWPAPVHVPKEIVPATDFNYHTQGMWLLPDGAVVFNVDRFGTVKLDACGEVVWKVDRITHHSITPNEDGSFWIPVRGDPQDIPEALRLAGIEHDTPDSELVNYEDRLMLVSADGIVKEEISVLKALVEGGFNHALHDAVTIKWFDPTHVNDIKVVTPALAARIDGVEAGDLLASIRQMHMLVIIGRENGRILWHHAGPWVRQHDPDITEDGLIEVFNNGGKHLPAERPRSSSIISLDPATGETRTLYPRTAESRFFTDIMGTHQLLPNGNRMITESLAGRVFEIDADGAIVWDYVKPYDDRYAALIESAIRYEADYLLADIGNCPQGEGEI